VRRRLVVLAVAAGLWMVSLGGRLYELQVVEHDRYRHRAERQQQRVVQLDPPRGTIYDARGRALGVSVRVDSAYAIPRRVGDARSTAAELAPLLRLDEEKLAHRLSADREFVWVARKLDPPVARAIRDLDLPGVAFVHEYKRYYPMRELAAQVLGYAGTDNQGLAGVELVYDERVAGKPGRRTVLRDALRKTILDPALSFVDPEPGQDLYLTLDASVQYIAESELARAVEEHGAKSGSVVLMDPTTGAVLAMASYPGFDPNYFSRYPPDRWRNRVVMDAYEPGSTFKMVTAAAALETNRLDPNDVIDCERGGIQLGPIFIADHKAFGPLTFREVIARSSNVGAVKAGLAVGDAGLYRVVRAFGFGQKTGIDLPGESGGILRPLPKWSSVSKAYIAFGHGLSVTPLQLASAFAAVARGGTLLQPFVVRAAGRRDGTEPLNGQPVSRGQVVAPSTVRQLERMLEAVVSEGTGTEASIPGYRVAGKTGTAQKPIPGVGYSDTRFVSTFVGFAPARRPAVVCLVLLDEPQGPHHAGGQVAAPVFARIVEHVLLYLGVPPERPQRLPWVDDDTGAAGSGGGESRKAARRSGSASPEGLRSG
jgi:cell division protein FtsI (penicillin-binding protein 3)